MLSLYLESGGSVATEKNFHVDLFGYVNQWHYYSTLVPLDAKPDTEKH